MLINSRNDTIINIDSNNDSTDAHFAIAHGAATGSSTELFRVQEDGKIGVGENSPDRLLHIKSKCCKCTAYSGGSDTADYNFLKIENTTNDKSARQVFFLIGSNAESFITATEVADGATDIAFQNRGGGVRSEKVRITSAGNIGINQTNPTRKLHIPASDSGSITQQVLLILIFYLMLQMILVLVGFKEYMIVEEVLVDKMDHLLLIDNIMDHGPMQ